MLWKVSTGFPSWILTLLTGKLQDRDSRKKSAFVIKNELFEFVKMPYGLCNSPTTYSRALNLVLCGLTWKTVLTFLDDVCVLEKKI